MVVSWYWVPTNGRSYFSPYLVIPSDVGAQNLKCAGGSIIKRNKYLTDGFTLVPDVHGACNIASIIRVVTTVRGFGIILQIVRFSEISLYLCKIFNASSRVGILRTRVSVCFTNLKYVAEQSITVASASELFPIFGVRRCAVCGREICWCLILNEMTV